MSFLVVLRPAREGIENEEELLQAHWAYLRELKEGGEAGSDDEHRAEVELQKVTDGRISELDELLKQKEEEILEV